MNTSTRRASKLLGSDVCGCQREEICSCEAQFAFLQCVQKSCDDAEVAKLCSAASSSCSDDLDIACGKEQSCRGWFHQAQNGVVGFVLNTEGIGERAYCGPSGKCQGELQVVAQLHRAYQGVWLECRLKDGEDFSTCTSEVFASSTKCRMPMIQGLTTGTSLVGKCWLTEGQSGPPITKDAWFTVANRHDKVEAGPVQSGAAGVRRFMIAVLGTFVAAAQLA